MTARALMLQGTGSDVGKSLLVAGLARAFSNRGLKVRPFKPQNMSNNAAVTVDGGEIGRAQALQARAARVAPSVHMNPVLLKPQSAIGAQVVVQGQVKGVAKAGEFQAMKSALMPAVLESFARIAGDADLVLVEGAGSASEVNLRKHDIANMGFARAANLPVVLVGDIDRGGVIASLVGTKSVLDPADAALIRGFVVNKFRGDPALFTDALTTIAQATGWTSLGLVPFFPEAALLPAEDALALDRPVRRRKDARVTVAVPILPHVSNFDDLDPLAAEPAVDLVQVKPPWALPGDADLVILLGSKATIAGLESLFEAGFHIDVAAHARRGALVLGLCGGYQMLGREVGDPDGVEGKQGSIDGLGLLDVTTVISGEKRLAPVSGKTQDGVSFSGFEMHMGVTRGQDCARPFAHFSDGRAEGAISANGRVFGTYIHGLFADDRQRAAWLARLGAGDAQIAYDAQIDATLDRLAAHIAAHVDLDHLLRLTGAVTG
jgi:adenosylcobyric acid synthase